MAFKPETIGGFGSGALGDVADDLVAANMNSYAHVTAIGSNSITIDTATALHGSYEDFTEGTEILFHVSTSNDTKTADYLGRFLVAKIISVTDNVLVVDQNITDLIPNDEFPKYNCQVVTIAQFKSLTLNDGTSIQPPVYAETTFVGGIVALKCSDTLNFNGGHIDVAERGIPNDTAGKNLRPLNTQESKGTTDSAIYAAWENYQAKYCLPLNVGDGTVFLAAKKLSGNTSSRIGNPAATGVQFIRGTGTNINTGGTLRQGGACIFIAAEELQNFAVEMIAKSRTATAGKGLGRCYIASNTLLRNDEGLYAYEIFSDPSRAMRTMNVKNFGSGANGTASNITAQINNYASVTAISTDRKTLTYAGKTTTGLVPITRDALVMIHFCHREYPTGIEKTGRFILAKVLADNGTTLTLDHAVPEVDLKENYVQVISVPQYQDFTLSVENSATPKWTDGKGGIFAIVVKNHCNLSGGKINVIGKGTMQAKVYYGRDGLATIGNNHDCDKLPIGQGNGSVFILAKELTMSTDTRIGALQDGTQGHGVAASGSLSWSYKGATNDSKYYGGSGAQGGVTYSSSKYSESSGGGYGSNGYYKTDPCVDSAKCGMQGAHIMIIADKINNFTLAAISTGGMARAIVAYSDKSKKMFGGAGFGGDAGSSTASNSVGGHGGYNGGGGKLSNYGGGSSGWAFIYCNEAVSQSTDGIII